MKTCTLCKTEKPHSEFYKQKTSKDGHGSWCKPCQRDYNTQWRKDNPDRVKFHNESGTLKYKYGITVEERQALLNKQGGTCAICPSTTKLSVDHCHDTGKVRGILCHTCNVGLGMFHNDVEKLRAAIAYLENQ